jgi:hybrid cluster-associated redox disulfide protein
MKLSRPKPHRRDDSDDPLSPGDIVSAVLARRPKTIRVFVRLKMACPGCALAPLMTLGEAAEAYGLDPQMLIAELEAAR